MRNRRGSQYHIREMDTRIWSHSWDFFPNKKLTGLAHKSVFTTQWDWDILAVGFAAPFYLYHGCLLIFVKTCSFVLELLTVLCSTYLTLLVTSLWFAFTSHFPVSMPFSLLWYESFFFIVIAFHGGSASRCQSCEVSLGHWEKIPLSSGL